MDWSAGDFNYDGTVNLTDLLTLLNNYGQSANPVGSSARVVPEPANGCLFAIGSVAIAMRRRKAQAAQA
jgi:hypothetical protein